MRQAIKKYAKEAIAFVLVVFIVSNLASMYRATQTDIDDSVCTQDADIVYFWATWCPICKMQSRNIEALASVYDVASVAVRSGEEEDVRRYMEENGLHFSFYNDARAKLSRRYGIGVFPTTIVCNRGKVAFIDVGYTSRFGLNARLWMRRWL